MAEDQTLRVLQIMVFPDAGGAVVHVHGYRGRGRARTRRDLFRTVVRVGEQLPLDEPGPLLMALSDALAEMSDNYAPKSVNLRSI